jgi:hypothetical protein
VADLLKIVAEGNDDRDRAGSVGQVPVHDFRVLVSQNDAQLESRRHIDELGDDRNGVRRIATPVFRYDQELAAGSGWNCRQGPVRDSSEVVDPLPQAAMLGSARLDEPVERERLVPQCLEIQHSVSDTRPLYNSLMDAEVPDFGCHSERS